MDCIILMLTVHVVSLKTFADQALLQRSKVGHHLTCFALAVIRIPAPSMNYIVTHHLPNHLIASLIAS